MAKSKLIRDLVAGNLTLIQAFDRLLVIAMELEDQNLIKWAKQEKNGYSDNDDLPEYRYVKLVPVGDYKMVAMGYITTYRHKILPTLGFTDELKNRINRFKNKSSIAQIVDAKKAINAGQLVGLVQKPEHFWMFEQDTNIQVISATLALNALDLENILECTKTKLIEVLTLLEKNFGNLDEVDIDTRNYDSIEIDALKGAVAQVINGDQVTNTYYITDSKIKNSNVGKDNKNEKTVTTDISPQITITSGEKKKPSLLKRIFGRRK